PTVVGPQWPVYVVEAHDSRFESVIMRVVFAKLLSVEFFPTVSRLGIGRICIFFFQGCYIWCLLLILCVHASRRGEEEALYSAQSCRFEHVSIDQDVVTRDIGHEGGDISDAAHVRREVIDLIDILGRLLTVLPTS